MRPSRLRSVRQIEKAKPSSATSGTPQDDRSTQPDPRCAKQIQELRQLGLSASTNASSEKLAALRQEYDMVRGYVRDVFDALSPANKLPESQLDRFTAMLFGNGRLVNDIVIGQRARTALAIAPPVLQKSPQFKKVAQLLYRQFSDLLPPRPWWKRLWQR